MHGACVSGLPVTDKHQLHQLVASRRAWPGYKKNLNPKRNGEIDKTRGSRQFLLNILWGYDADTGNTNVHFPVQRVFWFQLRCMYADVWHAQKRVATGRVDSQLGFSPCFSHRPSTTGSSAATPGLSISSLPSFSSQLHYGQLRLVHLLLLTFVSILYILSVICLHFLSFKCRLSPSFPLCVCVPGVISLLSACFLAFSHLLTDMLILSRSDYSNKCIRCSTTSVSSSRSLLYLTLGCLCSSI